MNSDMRVEYKLNQIVNTITEQNKIRLNELNRYPICIFYGQFPETLRQMIQMELISKIGAEEAVELIYINYNDKVEEKVLEAVNVFRDRMENGRLKLLSQYYVPVFFMADQLDAVKMNETLQKFHAQMKRMGFASHYKIWYYCIFNYEYMDGKECKVQIKKIQEDMNYSFPISIYTQNNLFTTEYQKYLKVAQVIGMHIFLSISQSDEKTFVDVGNANRPEQFIMGYWKLDVLKQKIVDYLIHSIDRQEEDIIKEPDYMKQIRENINKIVSLNAVEWIESFSKMPINYTRIKERVRTRRWAFRRPVLAYGEILALLYGREDAFSSFVKNNISDGTQMQYIERFFASDIGNLYAVTHKLSAVLGKIRQEYQNDREAEAAKGLGYDMIFRFGRKWTVLNVLAHLCDSVWKREAIILELEQKILFIDNLLAYIESPKHQELIEEYRQRNENEIRRLKLIHREASMVENSILHIADIETLIEEDQQTFPWNEDVLDYISRSGMTETLSQIKNLVQEWINEHLKEVLGNFAQRIRILKMDRQAERYYAARLDYTRDNNEREYLYIGMQDQEQSNSMAVQYQDSVRQWLPEAQVLERNWAIDMCFELFIIKKIGDLSEVYNLDDSEGGGNPC